MSRSVKRARKEAAIVAATNIQTLLQYKSFHGQSILGTNVICQNIFKMMTVEDITELIKSLLSNKKYHCVVRQMISPFEEYWLERIHSRFYHYSYANEQLQPLNENDQQPSLLQRTQRYFRSKQLAEKSSPSIEVDVPGGGLVSRQIEFGNHYCIVSDEPDILKMFEIQRSKDSATFHQISTLRNGHACDLTHRILEPFLISDAGFRGYKCKYIPSSSSTTSTLLDIPGVDFIKMFSNIKVVCQLKSNII